MILTNAVSFSARPYSARPFVAHSVQILQSRKVLFSFLDVLLNHIYAKCIHAVNHTLQGTFPDRKIICIYVPSLTVDLTRNARWRSRRSRYKAAAYVPVFYTLVPAPELSLSDAKNYPFRKMRDTLYRERTLWSGNESVEIRFVSGSFVSGTSASSPGVPRHLYAMSYKWPSWKWDGSFVFLHHN